MHRVIWVTRAARLPSARRLASYVVAQRDVYDRLGVHTLLLTKGRFGLHVVEGDECVLLKHYKTVTKQQPEIGPRLISMKAAKNAACSETLTCLDLSEFPLPRDEETLEDIYNRSAVSDYDSSLRTMSFLRSCITSLNARHVA